MLIGMLGAVIGILLFLSGFFTGKKFAAPVITQEAAKMTDELKQRRDEMIAEHDAFQKLVNYNVDVAYNTRPVKETED